jgi:mono/diheme cytochrome c family protein
MMHIVYLKLVLTGILITSNSYAVSADMAKGEALFNKWFVACHGPKSDATHYLQSKYHGEIPADILKRSDLTKEFIRKFLRTQTPMMSAFRPTELSDKDIESLAVYT